MLQFDSSYHQPARDVVAPAEEERRALGDAVKQSHSAARQGTRLKPGDEGLRSEGLIKDQPGRAERRAKGVRGELMV